MASSVAAELAKEYLTAKEVAEIFNVKVITVYRWVRKKKLTAHKTPGGELRFAREDVFCHIKEERR